VPFSAATVYWYPKSGQKNYTHSQSLKCPDGSGPGYEGKAASPSPPVSQIEPLKARRRRRSVASQCAAAISPLLGWAFLNRKTSGAHNKHTIINIRKLSIYDQ
jgi:hypothetical protein